VLHGVDPEAVDAELDPGGVDVAHARHDLGPLGEQVVEPDEVAVRRGLTRERRVAAVVVERHVVEPGGRLGVLVARVQERRVREGDLRVHLRELPAHVVAVVEGLARGVLVREVLLRPVRVLAPLVVDDVGGVVRDDVEEDLHPLAVGGVDERLHVGVRAEVGVDRGEVGDPVAVVAGALLAGRPLHGLVLEARGEPDGRRAQALDVVELARQALEVAAVVEGLVGGVEAGLQPGSGEPAGVVAGVAVGEPVGHDEVEPLAGERRPQRVGGQLLVGRRRGGVDVERREGDQVGRVVVRERQLRRPLEDEREVRAVLGAPRPVVDVPGAVEGDLELVAAFGDGERPGEGGVAHGRQGGGRAGGIPVAAAAELALERADEDDRGGGRHGRRCGEGEGRDDERGHGERGRERTAEVHVDSTPPDARPARLRRPAAPGCRRRTGAPPRRRCARRPSRTGPACAAGAPPPSPRSCRRRRGGRR